MSHSAFITLLLAVASYLSVIDLQAKVLRLGTATASGGYFTIGAEVANFISSSNVCQQDDDSCQLTTKDNILVMAISTGGSIDNITRLNNDDLDIGLVQGDVIYEYDQMHPDNKKLSLIANMFYEHIYIVVAKDSAINDFTDLKGKKVFIGQDSSGTNFTFRKVASYYHINDDNTQLINGDVDANMQKFINGEVDAFIIIRAYSEQFYEKIQDQKDIKFIDVFTDKNKILMDSTPAWDTVEIELGGQKFNTIQITSQLVTTIDAKMENIYSFTAKFWDPQVRNLLTTIYDDGLLPIQSLTKYNSITLHPGSQRFYEQVEAIPNYPYINPMDYLQDQPIAASKE
jgi:TRAP transporter TAXI family solute receptor